VSAAGIDLGGTKIETQVFDASWAVVARRRRPTPATYEALVEALAEEARWADAHAVGVCAAGLVNPATGLAYAANLPSTGRPLPADVARAAGRPVAWLNDCRALTLSEAVLGAARGLSPVAGLVIGTGVGGGLAVEGRLVAGHAATGGEFGHTAAAAHVLARHGLPVLPCGCGRVACVEAYASGPNLLRLARHLGAEAASTEALVAARARDPAAARAWAAWVDVVAEMMHAVAFVADPAAWVLGGGLSRVPGVADDLAAGLARANLPGFRSAAVLLAAGGEAGGARGAALQALREAEG
jgi:N-acetylglucosamine kinase